MLDQDYGTSLLVEQSPEEVFAAVTNPRGWWSEAIEGPTAQQGDEFEYHYGDVHRSHIKLVEVVPNKRVLWRVTDNYFNFVPDEGAEWKDTNMRFEIARNGDRTQLLFTHEGLIPTMDCYEVCSPSWTQYVAGSLLSLITTGQGFPNPKE